MIISYWIVQVAVGLRPKDSKVWFHPKSVRKTTCHDQSLKPCFWDYHGYGHKKAYARPPAMTSLWVWSLVISLVFEIILVKVTIMERDANVATCTWPWPWEPLGQYEAYRSRWLVTKVYQGGNQGGHYCRTHVLVHQGACLLCPWPVSELCCDSHL